MRTQKRGFRVASALFFLLIFLGTFSILISAQDTAPTEQQIKGCYFYPQGSLDVSCKAGGITQEVAKQDCSSLMGCKLEQWFKPDSTCSDIPDCKTVTCDAAKHACQEIPLGTCTQAGGKEIAAIDKMTKCTKGCCFVPLPDKPYCHPELVFESECKEISGLKQVDKTNYKFYNSEEVTPALCEQLYCQATVAEGSLTGVVKDTIGQLVSGAALELLGRTKTATTDAAGKYSFQKVVPATYSLKVSAAGYLDLIQIISISAGEAAVRDLTLQKAAGESLLKIVARDVTGQALPGITVVWKGPVHGTQKTDAQGQVTVSNIPTGTYTILISAVGYASQELKKAVVLGENIIDVTLQKIAFQGVQGATFVNSQKTYDVAIYVDGFFKSKSKYGDGINTAGSYSVSLPADGQEHTISATYHSFVSSIQKVTVAPGQVISLDLYLSPLEGECTVEGVSSQKNVEIFAVKAVPGEKNVRLTWEKPCAEVASYTLQKKEGENILSTRTLSGTDVVFKDDDVEWGKSYSYTIAANFDSGLSSQDAATAEIMMGDAACEKKYASSSEEANAGPLWSSFCLVEYRQNVYTCNEENKLTLVQDCSTLGSTWYCAQTTATTAGCKDAGICSVETTPFGLYASEEICYGSNNANFCYYDYSNTTIVDQCASCAAVQNCFAYNSKSACKKNNCLSKECAWIDVAYNPQFLDYSYLFSTDSSNQENSNLFNLFSPLMVTPETGVGYCVEKEYERDDYCSLCSPGASFLENYFCTPSVCSSLGKCFANPELTSCAQCRESPAPDATCYSYVSEMECIGSNENVGVETADTSGSVVASGISKDEFSRLSLSKDRCSWGRCAWDGARCFKDGNADKKDDCQDVKGSVVACRVDNSPPTTILEGPAVLSQQNSVLTFTVDDSSSKPGQGNALKTLYYCLSQANGPNACTSDKFISTKFKGLSLKENLPVNVSLNNDNKDNNKIFHPTLLKAKPEGEMFTVYFYSEDVFSNQEQVQQGTIYADVIPPQFEVISEASISGTSSQLVVHLENVAEQMSCDFSLKQILPLGEIQTTSVNKESLEKKAAFSNLKGVKYSLTVTCIDAHENVAKIEKQYSFDLEQNIEIIYPATGQILAKTAIPFKVKTQLGSTCALYDSITSLKIADFVTTEEGLLHETAPLSLIEKKYVAEQKVVCTEFLSDKTYEDYFDFSIDFTPPSVAIELQEDNRVVHHEDNDWKESFISQAQVILSCSEEGLGCKEIKYCLGTGCTPADFTLYNTYHESFAVNQTTKICYYATREEEVLYNDVSCGTIAIEGFSITLEKPAKYTYKEEMWGVSSIAPFDWQFYTKVPSQECKFDFVPQFSYDNLAKYKGKEKGAEGKYLFEKFPDSVFSSYPENGGIKTVYVLCKNGEGKLSPLQKMSLEYDPTAPKIISLSSSPEPVIEGISTMIKVETDDKTTCIFTNTESGKTYPFPGKKEFELSTIHEGLFYVDDFIGGIKEYVLSVVCENGAGIGSAAQNVTVHVDYTQKGSIMSISPKEIFVQNGPIKAEVTTSKSGYCEYKKNDEYVLFSETNGRVHRVLLNGTEEGKYIVPFRCFMGDEKQEGAFSYTIDRHPPIIESIDDGIATCGRESWTILVKTNETAIANYSYGVYAGKGSASNILVKRNLLRQGSSGPDLLIKIQLAELNLLNFNANTKSNQTKDSNTTEGLIVSVSATDAAGNIGPAKDSDGVIISNSTSPLCTNDTKLPVVNFAVVNASSCTSRLVSMNCSDATGCQNYLYGIGKTSEACGPNLPYNGKNIEIKSTNYICYSTQDAVGKNKTGTSLIVFEDGDGDGITDSCDICKSTLAGKVVDNTGCAEGQISPPAEMEDGDGDGLPDAWERQFNSITCQLSSVSKDSDGDGIADGQEDYDQDTLNNYQEFTNGKNPCVKEEVESLKEPEEPPITSAVTEEPPSNTVAWVLLILGVLLSFGGLGYLLYGYLLSRSKPGMPAEREPLKARQISVGKTPSVGAPPGSQDQFAAWKRARQKKIKQKERVSVFEEFGKSK